MKEAKTKKNSICSNESKEKVQEEKCKNEEIEDDG